MRLFVAAVTPGLAGCQAVSQPLARRQDSPSAIELSAPAQRPVAQCAAGRTARLSNGLVVSYLGPDPKDHDTCLSAWNGKTHRFVLGVIPKGRGHPGHSDERDAIRAALLGPPGTRAEFEDKDAALWGRVTVEHIADPKLASRAERRSYGSSDTMRMGALTCARSRCIGSISGPAFY